MTRFNDKVVIVTGSSTGIGRGIALRFGEEGARLFVTGRNPESLEKTRSLLVSSGVCEERIHTVIGDLTDETVQETLIQSTLDKWGQIDVLVNNAGGAAPDNAGGMGFDRPLSDFDYVFNLNTRSVLRLSTLALPHLEKTKGEIIMISSISGLPFANAGTPYYSASKAALDQIMRSLASHASRKGVRVNGVSPGWIETEILHKQGLSKQQTDEMQAEYERDFMRLPCGRFGQPADIANVVVFLADRTQSSYIVGQSIVCDGGTSMMNAALSYDPTQRD